MNCSTQLLERKHSATIGEMDTCEGVHFLCEPFQKSMARLAAQLCCTCLGLTNRFCVCQAVGNCAGRGYCPQPALFAVVLLLAGLLDRAPT